ncbi:hypothetical protein JCM8547_006035 [Rhodosporidiobolus lusitaniae]
MFVPATWEILRFDDERDEQARLALVAWQEKREREGAGQEELDGLMGEERLLLNRQAVRWSRLFMLDHIRRLYIWQYCALGSSTAEEAILAAPEGDVSLRCPHPPHSFWPFVGLPTPAPASSPSPSPPLTLASRLSKPIVLDYILPDVPTPQSRQLSMKIYGFDLSCREDMLAVREVVAKGQKRRGQSKDEQERRE